MGGLLSAVTFVSFMWAVGAWITAADPEWIVTSIFTTGYFSGMWTLYGIWNSHGRGQGEITVTVTR